MSARIDDSAAGRGSTRDEPRERRAKTGERRDDRARRTLEMVLDRFFRPMHWAARAADAAGLQTGRPIEIDRVLVPVGRRTTAPPLRVAFASDFHAGATTSARVLEEACAAIADEKLRNVESTAALRKIVRFASPRRSPLPSGARRSAPPFHQTLGLKAM